MSEPQSREELRRKFLTVGKAILLSGILVVAGLVSAIIGMQLAVRGNDVSTPDLLGKPAQEAEELLQAEGLQLAVVSRRYDANVQEGGVISQNPAPGGKIKRGREVRVIVSMGVRKEPVPALVGETLRSARAKLAQTDYRLGDVSEIELPDAEDGEVLWQFPEAGSEETGGTRIDLLVAREAVEKYVMPDILGDRLSRVALMFERHGIRMGDIRYRPARGKRRGTILRQYPEPGSLLRETDRIHVEVASRWH